LGAILVSVSCILSVPLSGVSAQQTPPAPATASTPAPLGVSPRGAMIRSLLVPGWGHAAIGAYGRGGFYFMFETATAYALVRTRLRLGEVRQRATFRESALRARLADEGVTDPAEIQARLDQDATLNQYRQLEQSRQSQQEDLIAFGIFLVFLSGADAYVSAHLARFPAPIELQLTPSESGRMDVGIALPVPNLP